MKLIVADTGPLLHLHQAGALKLLRHFTEVVIAPTVMAELRRHAPEIWAAGVPPWIRLDAPSAAAASRAAKWVDGELLDPDEAEALAMAAELLPDLFLTDDTAARVMAESLGLVARGSRGVVLYCAATGKVGETEARAHLAALTARSTLWLSATVKQRALSALAEIFTAGY